MSKNLEYQLKIKPAHAEQAWSAILEGNGVVLRFSSLLELARYLEVAAHQNSVIDLKPIPEQELIV